MSAPKPEVTPVDFPRQPLVLGIIGGGQLAKMLAQSASQFGCKVVILEKSLDCPAAAVAAQTIVGDWSHPKELLHLAQYVDVITLESEFVEADSLKHLEDAGHTLFPSSATMRVVQDKFLQKQALVNAGLPVPKFREVSNAGDIRRAGADLGWPVVLKKRCNGYDGKGNFTVHSADDVSKGWAALHGGSNSLMVEQLCPFTKELAVMITRGRDGKVVSYPVVETVQEHHVCRTVTAPASVGESISNRAREIAILAAEKVGMVGSMGVELFMRESGELCVNELAPRVHNSGHYTIEACECSQFENHIRAVLGWPLGSPKMVEPSAVMVNLLGTGPGSGFPHGMKPVLEMPGVHLHLYGKTSASKGRKMGHVTVMGRDAEIISARAKEAAAQLRFE